MLLNRNAQAERFDSAGSDSSIYSANISSHQVREYCPLGKPYQNVMSARAHDKTLRVTRTIAHLDASDNIERSNRGYRPTIADYRQSG